MGGHSTFSEVAEFETCLIKMEDGRMLKKILEGRIIEQRRRRGPRRRWLHDVEEDLRVMRARNWRWDALDRREWR